MVKRAAGPFEILEILGEGSFGTVCVARVTADPHKRRVALKILKGAYTSNPKILNRTRDEARLLSHINHPNVVRVERLIDIAGRPVVVMELVEGVSLDQLLLRFKQGVPAAVAIEVMRQTLIALHVAYYEATGPDGRPLKVIHRDIKPSNVLLSTKGELKVVDFGIAKGEFSGREAQTESVVLGSRPYMAPERLDGISDHPTVDVYSCGMSLFELITGRTMSLSINPVTHEQAMNRQLGYLTVEGISESGLEDLQGIIRRMCAYDRDYRPSSLEAARELEQCLYAISPRYRVGLEEFARTTVLPIYESRPRIRPEDAVQDESESDFIREVTGQVTSPTITMSQTMRWTPYVFVTGLSVLVAVLGTLAVIKFMSTTQRPDTVPGTTAPTEVPAQPDPSDPGTTDAQTAAPPPVQPPPQEQTAPPEIEPETPEPEPVIEATDAPQSAPPVQAPTGPTVQIEMHLPDGSQAQIGDQIVEGAGYMHLHTGASTAEVVLNDRHVFECRFEVVDDGIVRLLINAGVTYFTVDGQPQPACSQLR